MGTVKSQPLNHWLCKVLTILVYVLPKLALDEVNSKEDMHKSTFISENKNNTHYLIYVLNLGISSETILRTYSRFLINVEQTSV